MFKVLPLVPIVNIIRSYAKRVPTVKFRYGKKKRAPPGTCPAPAYVAKKKQVLNNPMAGQMLEPLRAGVIYDFQLPLRLQRTLLNETEIECINSGGATKTFT
ncbi:hypothetical protein ILUMI_12892 [Ignelater luminosus]|uniref:Uncharacterized protein n=1 Tax=Ignelater luminosus TaxID=2038154 RepID=A0A8K0CYR8_IGNLU|nr:hypothetical protein ILUMI_12892 [Ignelater luminosus]